MTESAAAGAIEGPPIQPALVVQRDLRRQRLSVAFRFLLVIPVAFVLYCLLLVGAILLLVGWFAALVLGRLPEPIANFLCQITRYSTRVNAYIWFLTDRYPPFGFEAPDYPVQVDLAPGRLNRLAVLFRLFLAIPAAILSGLATLGLAIAGFFIWLWVLLTGRVPEALFDAITAVLRYSMRFTAYSWLITSAYPGGLLGDRPAPPLAPGALPDSSAAPAAPVEAPEDTTREAPPAASHEAPPAVAREVPPAATYEGPPPAAAPAGPSEPLAPSRAPRGLLVLSAAARRLVILFVVLGIGSYAAGGAAGVVTGRSAPNRVETLSALRTAHDDLVGQGRQAQQKISACGSDASALRCVQTADQQLAGAFDTFTARVEGMEFPVSARDESAEVARVSRRFATALRELGAAKSVEEYTRLANGEINQLGSSFDQRYDALVTALTA